MATDKITVPMHSGYAFECAGVGLVDWRRVSDEAWDTVVYTPKGDERFLGTRYIDGSRCRVWQCADDTFRAQVDV